MHCFQQLRSTTLACCYGHSAGTNGTPSLDVDGCKECGAWNSRYSQVRPKKVLTLWEDMADEIMAEVDELGKDDKQFRISKADYKHCGVLHC
jgi:hypothetical protein